MLSSSVASAWNLPLFFFWRLKKRVHKKILGDKEKTDKLLKLPETLNLDGNVVENWKRFKYNLLLKAADLEKKAKEKKCHVVKLHRNY